jgi:hypothetical protein
LPGPFRLPPGALDVTIGTAGTSGHVVADAVQLIEVGQPDAADLRGVR